MRDLPWGLWHVWLVGEVHMVACRRGGRHREQVPCLAGKAHPTARWLLALRWQRLPAFAALAGTLVRHLDGILAYCHEKVPFGVVGAINGNIRAVIPRGQGYRDHEYLLLKVQRATADSRQLRAA